LWRLLLKDPAFYTHVPKGRRVGQYIYQRMLAMLNDVLAKNTFMMALIFQGCLLEGDMPPHLDPKQIDLIKGRLDRIMIAKANLLDYLQLTKSSTFDVFSLSNVGSYLNQEQFGILLKDLIRCAKPKARFYLRQFSTNHEIPANLQKNLVRDFDLETELEKSDRCLFIASWPVLSNTDRKTA